MHIQIIKSPTKNTLFMLKSRMRRLKDDDLDDMNVDAVGLIQGRLDEIFVAADVAEKSNPVIVREIMGSCPQQMTMIGIFGDTAAVEDAIMQIEKKFNSEKK